MILIFSDSLLSTTHVRMQHPSTYYLKYKVHSFSDAFRGRKPPALLNHLKKNGYKVLRTSLTNVGWVLQDNIYL